MVRWHSSNGTIGIAEDEERKATYVRDVPMNISTSSLVFHLFIMVRHARVVCVCSAVIVNSCWMVVGGNERV